MVVISTLKFPTLELQRLLQRLQIVAPLLQQWMVDRNGRVEGIVGDFVGNGSLVRGKPLPEFLALGLEGGGGRLTVLPLDCSVIVALSDMVSTR